VISHLSSETAVDCPQCASIGKLVKRLTSFTTEKQATAKPKVGQVTEEFIEDSRRELHQQKRDMLKNR